MSNRHVWSNIDHDGQRVWNVTTYTPKLLDRKTREGVL